MRRERFETLDGLRGLACLSVVIFHFFSAFVPALISEQSPNSLWISDTPIGILYNGGFAVSVFFVLSGFVVSNAVHPDNPPIFVLLALCRRYLRLAIPSAFSTAIALLALTMAPTVAVRLQAILHHAWLTYVVTPPFPGLTDAIFEGAVGVFGSGNSLINNVLWTMKIELIGSFAIILIFSLTRGGPKLVLLTSMAGALMVAGRPEYAAFMLGALLCEFIRHRKAGPILPIVAMIFAAVVGAWTKGFGDRIGLTLPASIALGEPHKILHTLAAVAMVYAALTYEPLMKLLAARTPLFLGRISFGLYLLHVPLIYTLVGYVYLEIGRFGLLGVPLLLVFFVLVSVTAAYVFTLVVDEPAIKALREINRWFLAAYPRRSRGRPAR